MKHETVDDLIIDVCGGEADTVLRADGRITIDSSPAFRDRLLEILHQKSNSTLTVDLTHVTYIDCSGLATLVEALKVARVGDTTLNLRLHDRPRYLLEVTGLLPLFEAPSARTAGAVSKDEKC